jgi:hypothetical protein
MTWAHYTRYFPLLYDGHSEMLPLLWNRGVQLINGENGNLVQELAVEFWRFPYISVAATQGEFAVISADLAQGLGLKIQRFSRGPDGMFYLRLTSQVALDFRYTVPHLVIINPFRNLVAACPTASRGIPEIARLVSRGTRSSGTQGSLVSGEEQSDELAAPSVEVLSRGAVTEITLPPKYSHHRKRRLFIPDDKYGPRVIQFVDGDRILYRTFRDTTKPDAYYVFDFGLRMRRGPRSIS